MPYKVQRRDRKYVVVKEDDGEIMGRHDTEREADAQVRALYASERRSSRKSGDDDLAPGDGLTVYGWEPPEIKSGSDGELAGYLWRWGSPELPDATKYRDYFTRETQFGRFASGPIDGYLHHALPSMKGAPNPAGDAAIGEGAVTLDYHGGWLKARLDLSVPGVGDVWDAMKADDDAFGLSSGAVSHLVRRVRQPNGSHWLKRWPVAEWSLTPDPGERRTAAVALKSLIDDDDDDDGAPAAGASLIDRLSRLVADARDVLPLTAKAADQRRSEGRDLSRDKLEALAALGPDLRTLAEAVKALAPAAAPDAGRLAKIERLKRLARLSALGPTR